MKRRMSLLGLLLLTLITVMSQTITEPVSFDVDYMKRIDGNPNQAINNNVGSWVEKNCQYQNGTLVNVSAVNIEQTARIIFDFGTRNPNHIKSIRLGVTYNNLTNYDCEIEESVIPGGGIGKFYKTNSFMPTFDDIDDVFNVYLGEYDFDNPSNSSGHVVFQNVYQSSFGSTYPVILDHTEIKKIYLDFTSATLEYFVIANNNISGGGTQSYPSNFELIGSNPMVDDALNQTFTYQWQTLNNGVWTNISGANQKDFQYTGQQVEQKKFRRITKHNNAGDTYSNVITCVTTTPSINNNIISGCEWSTGCDVYYCGSMIDASFDIFGSMPTGGNGEFMYIWEEFTKYYTLSSTGGMELVSKWRPMNVDDQNLLARNIPVSDIIPAHLRPIRRKVVSEEAISYSNVILIKRYEEENTITSSGPTSSTSGFNPSLINGTNLTNSTYEWQKKTANTNWITVGNQQSYNPPFINESTSYRRIASNGLCDVISDEVQYTISGSGRMLVVNNDIDTRVSIDENKGESFKIYPTSVTNQITLESSFSIDRVQIFSANGTLVYSTQLNTVKSATLDLPNIAAGIYFVKIFGFESSYVKRIIKL